MELLLICCSGEFLERVLAGEVDAALLVDLGDLDPHHVADLAGVLHLLDALVGQLGDVNQAVLAGSQLHEGAEGHQAHHAAVVQLADLGDEHDIVDALLGGVAGGGVRCGSICGAVSAPVMLLGTACPDPTDRAAVTARVKEYQRRFTGRFHRLDCRELLRSQELEPSELALELAGSDHCGRLIVTAAEILTDMLEEA